MTQQSSGTTPPPSSPSKGLVWAGRVVSAVPVLMLTMSAVMKFSGDPELLKMFTGPLGFPAHTLQTIGIIEIASVVLYALPHTAVLGAVLLTGYLGGAIVTHMRIEDPVWTPLGLGVVVWLGIWLRDARLRELMPLRRL